MHYPPITTGELASSAATMPLASIIIPTYNRKHLLCDAVQSCLEQSWRNIEVIIVDDGSTDGTEACIAQQITGPWRDRVKYCRQSNAGASAARNKGLELATGKYVQFLDSDDILFKDKIALQVRQLEAAPSEQVLCSCFGRVGPYTNDLAQGHRIGIQCATPTKYIRQMCGGVIHGMQTSAPLWKRSFLVNRPGWRTDISLGDDLEYYLRLLTETRSVGFVAQDLFLVREHDGPHLSDSGNNRDRVVSAIRAHQAVAETVRNAGIWDTHIQEGILRKARTLYVNVLKCGTADDIKVFEEWMWRSISESQFVSSLKWLICGRRIFGRHLVVSVINDVQWLRKYI